MHTIVFALVTLSVAPVQAPAAQDQPRSMQRVEAALTALSSLTELTGLSRLDSRAALRYVHEFEDMTGLRRLRDLRGLREVSDQAAAMNLIGAPARLPAEGWAAQDPADSLWRAARAALDNGNAREAADLYRRIRTERRFANSEYRPHAFYWEAYARQRIGGTTELRRGLEALRELKQSYGTLENRLEVERLETRLNAELAAAGDGDAGERITRQRERAVSQCPDQEERVTVLESFISMPSQQAMPILKQVMARKDACSAVLREKAVFIISQKGSAEAEDLLLDAARNDPEPKVREQAVFWLSQVNSEKSLVAIEEILRNATDEKLIEQAVFAVSQHRSDRARQILRDIASRADAPMEVRKNAIFWIGQSRGEDVSGFMRELYSSVREEELKEAVLFALSQNGDAANGQFLLDIATNDREPIEMRKTALFWAGQKRALPLDRLSELYRSTPDREMREAVIFSMSQRREPEVIERLIEIARSERDTELRKTVIFWLGQSKDPRAVKYLGDIITGG